MEEEKKRLIKKTLEDINAMAEKPIRIMEVCGTHTHQIAKLGLRSILNKNLTLVSGPGCPVCVTDTSYLDCIIKLLETEDVTVLTFGDLLRVKGSRFSLEEKKAEGKKVISVYSPEEIIFLAEENKKENFVFAAVGFETTAPLYAQIIKIAERKRLKNLFFITSLKKTEPAIRFILQRKALRPDGILCPGHVAAITGIKPFLPITNEYKIPAVICGFNIYDLVYSINILCRQIMKREPLSLVNAYKTCVKDEGNKTALNALNEVFKVSNGVWRAIGSIDNSAFTINNKYEKFDALKKFELKESNFKPLCNEKCECGSIILGEKIPSMCKSFGTACTFDHPLGPCMISSEGACAAYYRYGGGLI